MENKTDMKLNVNDVDAILQKGVDFNVEYIKPNILQKLFFPKGREFLISPVCMGTLLKISKELEKVKPFSIKEPLDKENENLIDLSIDSVVKYKDNLIKVIAYSIANSNKEPDKKLLNFLDANLTAKETLSLIVLVISQMGVQDFLASMVLATRANLMAETDSTPGNLQAA